MDGRIIGTSEFTYTYISRTYGSLLAHERRIAEKGNGYKNKVNKFQQN
jgi:hypothetical protein